MTEKEAWLELAELLTPAEVREMLDDVECWGELDTYGSDTQVRLREAYIILDFMPDPPKLPEIGSND